MPNGINKDTIILHRINGFLQKHAALMDHEYLIHICKTSYAPEQSQEAIRMMRSIVPECFNTPETASIDEQLYEIVKIFRQSDTDRIPTFVDNCKNLMKALHWHMEGEVARSTFTLLQENITNLIMRLLASSELVKLHTLLEPQPISGSQDLVFKRIGLTKKRWLLMTQQEITDYTDTLIWLRENVRAVGILQTYANRVDASVEPSCSQLDGMQLDMEGLALILEPRSTSSSKKN